MHRAVARALAAPLFVAGVAGCSVDTGSVEVAWVFVDRGGDAIFPGGLFDGQETRNACDLPASLGGNAVRYDLGMEMQICDPLCEAGCDAAQCQIVAPIAFDCLTSRGSSADIPSADEPYRFTLKPRISISDGTECEGARGCIAAPGPRERTVDPGLTVDLQVYQFVVDIESSAPASGAGALQLDECVCET